MEHYTDMLLGLPLFDRIDAAEFSSVLHCIGGFVKSYDPGSFIIPDGGPVECVGVVLTGKVYMIKEDIWGGKAVLAVIGPSQVFGETYVFGGAQRSNAAFVSANAAKVLFLPFKRVLHTCSKSCEYHQRLVDNMVSIIARKNLQLTEKLEITTQRTLRTKILTYLSQESQRSGSTYFTVPFGRLEMAEYLCADRSALTRELRKMQEEGLLDYSENTFRLFIGDPSVP